MTERIALHTRLKPGHEESYDALHRRVRDELAATMVAGGVREWRIWRAGQDLFHLVDVDDWEALLAHLADDPVDKAWQAEVGEHLEVNLVEGEAGLKQVWHLSSQIDTATGEPHPTGDAQSA